MPSPRTMRPVKPATQEYSSRISGAEVFCRAQPKLLFAAHAAEVVAAERYGQTLKRTRVGDAAIGQRALRLTLEVGIARLRAERRAAEEGGIGLERFDGQAMVSEGLDVGAHAEAQPLLQFVVVGEIVAIDAGGGVPSRAEAGMDLAAVEVQRRHIYDGEQALDVEIPSMKAPPLRRSRTCSMRNRPLMVSSCVMPM